MTDAPLKHLLAEIILSDEQLKAIGCLVVESSHMETYIEAAIRTVCGNDDVAEQLMWRKMLDAKVDIFKEILTPKLKGVALEKFNSWYSRLKADIASRNTVVHGDWGLARSLEISDFIQQQEDGTTVAIRKNAKAQVKATEVVKIARRLAHLQNELLMFWIEYVIEGKALRKVARKRSARPSESAPRLRNRKIAE